MADTLTNVTKIRGRPSLFGRPMTAAERQRRSREANRARRHQRRRLDMIRQQANEPDVDLSALPPFSLDDAAQFLADRT
jgi:hypothetical protein